MLKPKDVEFYVEVCEWSPAPLSALNLSGEIVWGNASFCDVLGVSADVCSGSFLAFVSEDERSRVQEIFASASADPQAPRTTVSSTHAVDGATRTFQWWFRRPVDSDHVHCSIRDISDEVAERQRTETHLVSLYEETPVMLHSINMNGQIEMVSDHWLEKMGYTRDEVIGRSSVEFLTEDSRAYAAQLLPEYFRTGRMDNVEYQFVTRDGEVLDCLLSASAERDNRGDYKRSRAVVIDVTARKRYEKALRGLAASNADLEQFAYVASHDLQAPLRTVASYSDLFARQFDDSIGERARKYLRMIQRATESMQELIQDLLEYSRITHANGPPPGVISADEALEQAMIDLDQMIRECHAEVVWSELPSVCIRRRHLVRLFENLVGNAIKYRAPTRTPRVEVNAVENDHMWQFSVQDNGIGIESQYLETIFEVFQRLHGGETYEGTGLGLAICRKIVERSGGRVWAISEVNQGSTFLFTLPKNANFGDR